MGASCCLTDVAVRLSPCSCESEGLDLWSAVTRRLGPAESKRVDDPW